jgi:hypothetical protein
MTIGQWLPYLGLVLVVGGWLRTYWIDQYEHEHQTRIIEHLTEQVRVLNVVTYSVHPEWRDSVLAAER